MSQLIPTSLSMVADQLHVTAHSHVSFNGCRSAVNTSQLDVSPLSLTAQHSSFPGFFQWLQINCMSQLIPTFLSMIADQLHVTARGLSVSYPGAIFELNMREGNVTLIQNYAPAFTDTHIVLARTIYIWYFWQGNHQIFGHIRWIYTFLANPIQTCI